MVPNILCARLLAIGPLLLLLAFAPPSSDAATPPPQTAAHAQPPQQPSLQHVAWRKRDGAPSGAIGIAQDSKGMLWFATFEGLYRFDGVRFDRMDAIDGHQLLATDVAAVAAYGDALWVGYRFGGVSVFEHGAVTHYQAPQGLPQRTAQAIARTADGVMWAGTYVGVYRLDGQRWSLVGEGDGLPADNVTSLNVAPNGALLAYLPDGVYLKQPGSRRFRRIAGVPVIESGEVRGDGAVLLKSRDRQLFVLDPVTEVARALALPQFTLRRLDVMQEKNGTMWVLSPQGLHLFDPSLTLQKTYSMETGFSGRIVHSFMEDREGNAWFSTENGVDRISVGRINKLEPLAGQSLHMSVLAGDHGEVWIGSSPYMAGYDDTVYRVARDGSRVVTPIHHPTASTRGSDGSLWLAGRGVLWRVQGTQYQHWPLPDKVRSFDVQAMAVDARGLLWLSIVGIGIYTFQDGAWARPADAQLAQRTAISLHRDARGQIWFGYPQSAMAMLAADGTLHRFDASHGLAVGNVLAMASRGQRLWIGGDHGFGYWDGARFHGLRDRDGPAFYGVSGIVETAAGDVWLHGTGGLVHIAARALADAVAGQSGAVAVERFDYLDGYEGVAAQLRPIPTLTETTDGRIWYATTAHTGWIDPRRISRNPLAPTPQITAVQTAQRPYPVTGPVHLPAGTEDIQLDFTAAVLTIPERARFRYRLAGLETAWREAGARRQAFYTNMRPGDYRFEVQASNEDGVWSKQTAHLDVSIAPTFVQTAWFKLLCVMALALVVYGWMRWRVQLATTRATERLRERLNERTRIARTLHDSFLQSVHALIMRFERIKRGLALDDPLQREIDSALNAADAVLLEGRDQVWALRSGDAAPVDLEPDLRQAAGACGVQYGVSVTLATHGAPALLPEPVRDEALAIVLEALHNACRHSGVADVHIALRYLQDSFELRVTDAGCGIAEQVLAEGAPPGHWGLAGMRERAQLIGATLHIGRGMAGGTEVCLVVPLHGVAAR
jgi:signal transduction histidine kinase/ligand-binding sensor domain-containing protein